AAILVLVLTLQSLIPSLQVASSHRPGRAGPREATSNVGKGCFDTMSLHGRDLVELLAHPRSVAVVGASTNPASASGRPLDYLLRFGFDGTIVPVNARHAEVGGLPAVASLGELEHGTVDAALIAVPAPAV